MRRRGWTVATGAVLVAAFTWQILGLPVPYAVLGPGVSVDTVGTIAGRPVISITDGPSSDSAGQLRLVTVNISTGVTLGEALWYWVSGEYRVVPREVVFPPDKTEEQVEEESREDFQRSQTSAETAALRALGFPVQVGVQSVAPEGPSAGKLAPGDLVTSVDGKEVTSVPRLGELLREKAGARTIGYSREGQAGTASIAIGRGSPEDALGVQLEQRQPHPFRVSIDQQALNNIGGPSAGLMFALGIVDRVDPADLTSGAIIAGTGTIDDDGVVGPIGGVAQKLLSAQEARARVFLTPEENCKEAVENAVKGIKLVKVHTLDDALSALTALRDRREPPVCTV